MENCNDAVHNAGAPELLHALALKMHTQMWLTTSRGFNGVLGGLSGFSNTYPHAGDMLRTVRASCVRAVCAQDTTRGVQLVRAIQVAVSALLLLLLLLLFLLLLLLLSLLLLLLML